ncbi:hypothetical protein EOM60_00845 [Candidatus Saccharibacteria bacterium]|nr:hypothetical protein [Candidatus Saccharibacteria bacterium]
MSVEMEYERTYLCQEIPQEYISGDPVKMVDVYVPEVAEHPTLRVRQRGDRYVITRKAPVDGDSSRQLEETIKLSAVEAEALMSSSSRRIEKLRYPLLWNGFEGELDVFGGEHEGLVMVDFEFTDTEKLKDFQQPDFCLAEFTHEVIVAGGILSGMKSDELWTALKQKYAYNPVRG